MLDYEKPFKINPEKYFSYDERLNARDGCPVLECYDKNLEHEGYKLVNSLKCNEICNNKWYNHNTYFKERIFKHLRQF